MDLLKKSCIWCNQKVFSIRKVLTKCASSSDPSMDWCKHLGVGIYALISWSKHIVVYKLAVKPVFTRKWVGALQHFWKVYANDILLIGNNVEFSGKHKGVFERSFSKKDFGEAAYILSIKIYRDRSRRLTSFFNEYIPWQDFEVVQNGKVKEGVLACITRCGVQSDSMPDHCRR